MNKFVVGGGDASKRLDNFLIEQNNSFTRSHYKNLIDSSKVTVNGKSVKAGYSIKLGDVIEVADFEPIPLKAEAEEIDLNIVYEDDCLVVVNKPKGMVVHPACGNWKGTLVNALLYNVKNLSGINGVIRPGIVHRLDKDTSGLLVVAKNDFAHVELSRQIANKTCKRIYLALLNGNLKNDSGVVTNYLCRDPKNRLRYEATTQKGKFAETHYTVVERFKDYCLVKFELKTGRTHQIRVHSKCLNHPIVGDELYGAPKPKFKVSGQMLHATNLEFVHPKTEKVLSFSAPLPAEFEKVLKILRAN